MNNVSPVGSFVPTTKQIQANVLMGENRLHTLLRGGSRSGKTFIICRRIARRALIAPGSRHAIWRFHYNHAKNSIGVDTFPKMMRLCFPAVVEQMGGVRFSHEGVLKLPNNSEIWLGGLDDKERVEKILGQEFATNFFSEASQIPYSSVEIAHSRLAQRVLIDAQGNAKSGQELPLVNLYDMNPPSKRHWSYEAFVLKRRPGTREPLLEPDQWVEMLMNPHDNRENLPDSYFRVLEGMSKAKRIRFLKGEWANDAEGMLWNDAMLDDARIGVIPEGVRLVRVVVGVDPSGSKGRSRNGVETDSATSNDIGIVVMGLGSDGIGYVLEDATINASPAEWGARVVRAAEDWKAERVVAELNYGGDMVRFVLQSAKRTLPVKMVRSSRGKALRAEPVAALYEPNQRRIKHVGIFDELESQMTSMMPQPHGYQGEGSPDRLDAMVFAATELLLGDSYSLGNL